MNLQLPDKGALLHSRHIKQHMGSDAPLERRIKVRCQVGRKDYDPIKSLEFAKENVDRQVALAVVRQNGPRRTARRDGISFIKKQHRVLLGGGAK